MWYRLVGVDLSQSNLAADAETSIREVTRQLNAELVFGPFVQVVARNASVTTGTYFCRHTVESLQSWLLVS